MASESTLAVQTRNLTRNLGDFTLQNIDLSVPAGALCAVLGAHASGKTALIKLLVGLDDPDSGQRMIFGQDIALNKLRTRLRYAPQSPKLQDTQSIQEAMRFTTFLSGQQYIEPATIVETLYLVDLNIPIQASSSALTIAERQRLRLAQALVGEPQLLVLDEPAGLLLGSERQSLLNTVRKISSGRTLIYTSSLPTDSSEASDFLAVLHEGRLIAQGPTDDILANAEYGIYQLTIRGDATTVRNVLADQAWVHAIHVVQRDDYETWTVQVNNEFEAERGLLRAVLADRSLHVVDYLQLRPQLCDILNKLESTYGASKPTDA